MSECIRKGSRRKGAVPSLPNYYFICIHVEMRRKVNPHSHLPSPPLSLLPQDVYNITGGFMAILAEEGFEVEKKAA